MTIGSSILNPITFKNLSNGSFPNSENTLHSSFKAGAVNVFSYCQPWQNNQSFYLQFWTTDSDVPVLKSYIQGTSIEIETLSQTLIATVSGTEGTRYFWEYLVSSADYNNKTVYFKFSQTVSAVTTTITSEPVEFEDLTEDIINGTIKVIEFTNLDREDSFLSGFFMDFENTQNTDGIFRFYVEGTEYERKPREESELLEGVQSFDIIYASLRKGCIFKTGMIPAYMADKITAASMLDYFTINGIRYLRDGAAEQETLGTSYMLSYPLIERLTLGINVDNLGLSYTMGDEWLKFDGTDDDTGALTYTVPANYSLHQVFVKHSGTSSGNEGSVKIGTSAGGDDILTDSSGYIPAAGGEMLSFPAHYKPYSDSDTTVYLTVSGTGVKIWLRLVFERMNEFV